MDHQTILPVVRRGQVQHRLQLPGSAQGYTHLEQGGLLLGRRRWLLAHYYLRATFCDDKSAGKRIAKSGSQKGRSRGDLLTSDPGTDCGTAGSGTYWGRA